MEQNFTYKCACCGLEYGAVPLCFGAEFPASYFSIPEEDRAERIEITESLCVIDGEHFFHRGRITIPIHDYPEDLLFNVWTSISEANFRIRMDSWEDVNRVNNAPYFGWLQTMVPGYGDTLSIKTQARETGLDTIPEIEITEEGHPLTIDQQQGISFAEALKKVDGIMREAHLGKI
ncbi:DUF2199 domain-containing protein [Chitinophaga arvensicola]|uniref:DUF2199 domain-containing protein n=1 Tax=Chitinophaga arvensicola TaxID=29529 RepID=A0A1I0SBN1_9BACT|nr:DUF2199 domain-containing protein [Chitinophaga arvensicola]SEW54135.1 hypothetical protein SAMN04488122_5930 [Chitinophaga arvensicola]